MSELLDTVALTRDIPGSGLKRGDLGAVVESYPSGAMEVEFVAGSGRTQALLTPLPDHIRQLGDQDLLAVRSLVGTDG